MIEWIGKGVSSKIIGIFGLILSSLGAVISVLSFIAGDGRQTSSISGIDYHIALISDTGFKAGFFLLILGFVMQITEKAQAEVRKNISIVFVMTICLLSILVYFLGVNILSKLLFR